MISTFTKNVIINTICDSHTLKKALKIAIVVGTILNIINQGDYILNMMFEKINYFKLILTYFVPFFVSTYTAININMRLKIGGRAVATTKLICKNCKSSLQVNENSTIPDCPKCKKQGHWEAS